MSQIKIRGKRESMETDYKIGNQINNNWTGQNGQEKKEGEDQFMLNNMTLKYSMIEWIDLSDKPEPQENKEKFTEHELNNFISKMIDFCKQTLPHQIEWYGKDEQNEKKLVIKNIESIIKEKKYRVYNPIIGLCDARIVEYCLQNNILSDKNVPRNNRLVYWSIKDSKSYDNFINLYKAMMKKKYQNTVENQKLIQLENMI